ncbi:Uncharacterised protein [Serratia proteamaculans]|nr:Uncharacterised protein [Serratia proteamaculans]
MARILLFRPKFFALAVVKLSVRKKPAVSVGMAELSCNFLRAGDMSTVIGTVQ